MLLTRAKILLLLCGLLLVSASRGLLAENAQCLDCHTASADVAVHAVFNTPHGSLAGGGQASCIACHGGSEEHRDNPTGIAPTVSFGPHQADDRNARNNSCLACHEKGPQMLWTGSEHQQQELSCDSCHDIHQQRDPTQTTSESVELCLGCHPRTRAEAKLPSHHPILEGKTGCTDCHNPHGSMAEAELQALSINDNCYGCHQEKRGPFLWEHAPVTEDCSLCHRAHGSVNPRLLKARGSALCQQCHAVAFHPSLPYGAEGLPGAVPNQNLLGKNCLNCHSQVHGSNHPSGARLTR
jgi:DmsE family decaheme c-type cytochrome